MKNDSRQSVLQFDETKNSGYIASPPETRLVHEWKTGLPLELSEHCGKPQLKLRAYDGKMAELRRFSRKNTPFRAFLRMPSTWLPTEARKERWLQNNPPQAVNGATNGSQKNDNAGKRVSGTQFLLLETFEEFQALNDTFEVRR